jgi:hypothetical protein
MNQLVIRHFMETVSVNENMGSYMRNDDVMVCPKLYIEVWSSFLSGIGPR